MSKVNITDAQLAKSAQTYSKTLLQMPVVSARSTLRHMTGRPGVRGRHTVGELSGDIELGPYDPKRKDESGVAAAPRTLETYFGSVIKPFDPNSVWETIYGSLVTQGEGLKNVDITRQVLMFLMAKLGKSLNSNLWKAVRNDTGTKTKDLFDGFDTITTAEKTAGNIAAAKGNMKVITAITAENAVDTLKAFYRAASDELQGVRTKLFVPVHVYNDYVDDYQSTVGSVPYNKEFEKTFLEGSSNLCELVPLSNKKNSPYIHLSTKGNMLYGYGNGLADERVTVEKHHPFLLDFVSTMFFGVQFESISPERLLVGTIDGTTAV